MKREQNLLLIAIICIIALACGNTHEVHSIILTSKKELVIAGDAHGLPDNKKQGYRPMLEKLMIYKPEMVFSEHTIIGDTAAFGEWHKGFKEEYLKSVDEYKLDKNYIEGLLSASNSELDSLDFVALSEYYLYKGNMANQWMYEYFAQYGAEKSFAPRGNQNSDLTFELMRSLKLKEIHGVDSHYGYQGYWPKWQECETLGDSLAVLEYKKIGARLDYENKETPEEVYLDYINSERTLDLYYKLNTLRLDGFEGTACDIQRSKWDHRNQLMASNLKNIINENNYQKSVLIVGAGHAHALELEFQKLDHDFEIIMFRAL